MRGRAGMREVAELAGVAISSVSRVLSGHPDVSPAMRARVLDAVARLEYEPDFLAQSLRRGQTLSAGFVLADLTNPLMSDIVHGAEAILRARGYSLLLMSSESDPALDAAHIRFLQTRRVDGLILSLASESHRPTLDTLAGVTVPLVVVDRALDPSFRASAVVCDHAAGMRAAVEHLVRLGHRRIALIGGSRATLPARQREEAMRAVVAEAGGAVDATTLPGTFSREHGAAATRQLLDGPSPPTAIIAGGNQLLIGALEVIGGRGLLVGRDLSLVTCDDVPLITLYRPPIASIARDTVGLGATAATLLLDRLDDPPGPPMTAVLSTSYTPRASVAPPPG